MADLRGRDDVTWNAVQEAHQSWDYRSQGISPTGAVLISLAVSAAIGPGGMLKDGMGASLFGDSLVGMGFEAGTASAIANAGFTSLITQAATALVGNGGDIGAALKQLGSIATIKSLATSMVTAGLIEGLGVQSALSTPTTELNQMTDATRRLTEFTDKLKIGIAQGSIRATVDSVINGTNLSGNLKSNMISLAADMVSETGSRMLGDTGLPDSDLRKVLGHAFVGGMSAKVAGEDFAMGAAAGAITEILSPFIGQTFTDGMTLDELAVQRQSRVELAGIIAATTVALAGGDAGDIYRAASIGQIARQYNAELHPSVEGMIASLKMRQESMDSLLQDTDPDAVKAVLQRMADADVRSVALIDTTGLDPNAIKVVQKYGTLTTAIVATPEEAAGMVTGMAESIGGNVYDTALLVTDQAFYLAWLATGGLVGNAQVERNFARVDALVGMVKSLVGGTLPAQFEAYYQSQKNEAQRLYDAGDAYNAKRIMAKINTDIFTGIVGVVSAGAPGGRILLTKADEIVTASKTIPELSPALLMSTESAQNIATASKLAEQLRLESAYSPFNEFGRLTADVLSKGREIIPAEKIGNTQEVPSGFSKFTSPTFNSPSGDFQVHYYYNTKTGDVFYDADYKVIFNSGAVNP